MPAGDYDDAPRVRSWITPKAAKGGASAIEGRGVHAVEVIPAGEVVAVKGGDIVDGSAVAGLPGAIRDSAFPIAAAQSPHKAEGRAACPTLVLCPA